MVCLKEEIRIMVLCTPYQRFRAASAGDPDRWVGFLQRNLKRVDYSELVMLALPTEGTGSGPSLNY
jgi:hypothetical protein